jgi:hypothetical protein
VKPYTNSGEVHSHLSNNRHPVDAALVGARSVEFYIMIWILVKAKLRSQVLMSSSNVSSTKGVFVRVQVTRTWTPLTLQIKKPANTSIYQSVFVLFGLFHQKKKLKIKILKEKWFWRFLVYVWDPKINKK